MTMRFSALRGPASAGRMGVGRAGAARPVAGRRVRALWGWLHRWLGLSVGLLFVLAGLTGSLLVFYPALDRGLHPALRPVPAAGRPPSYEAVYQALLRAEPGRDGPWRIEVTETGGPIPVRYYRPAETEARSFAPLMLWIDPHALTVLRRAFWGDYLTTWLYDLHYRLLLGADGAIIMGVAGIGQLLLLLGGLYLWWPAAGKWRGALALKRGASPQRRIYDLHKLAGLTGLLPLLVVVVTGVLLSLPGVVRPLLDRVSPLHVPVIGPVPLPPEGRSLDLDAAVAVARQRFPTAELAWIETPGLHQGAYRINLWQPGEPSRRFPRTNVWVHPLTGRILDVRDGLRDGAGDTLLAWLHPLHSGEAFGMAGRWLILLSGLVPPVLCLTGFLRWRHKRHARRASVGGKAGS